MKQLIIISFIILINNQILYGKQFRDDFMFGVATSAYQVEGAWNESGKGMSIWDYNTHENNATNADVAADSYHKTDDDVKILAELGVNFYKFSISWARLLPNGLSNKINQNAVIYYNNLIDRLLDANIKPFITLYHWDLPLPFQLIGGWTNSVMIDYFSDYARIVFDLFGDRVQLWMTFNEPTHFCKNDYEVDSPTNGFNGVAVYLCAHTILRAHAKVYRLYQKEFKDRQNGKLGLGYDLRVCDPLNNNTNNVKAGERCYDLMDRLYTYPIYSKTGDYPKSFKEYIAKLSKEEGFPRSRLPTFTKDESEALNKSADFLAINYYGMHYAGDDTANHRRPSYDYDLRVEQVVDDAWEKSVVDWLMVVPKGIRKLLNWIKNEYDNPLVFVTENGYPDYGEINDFKRINYINEHLQQIHCAIDVDDCNVIGYAVWSFIDSFEWLTGYNVTFGLYKVNFTDPNRERIPKLSSFVYRNIIRSRKIDLRYLNGHTLTCT